MKKKRKILAFLWAGSVVGGVSVLYNIFIFKFLGFYPGFLTAEGVGFFDFANPVFVIFVKDFFVGFLLAALFRAGCRNINYHMGWGIFYFILYSVTAFLIFSVGDFVLMRSGEGILLLLTLDGFIETMVCTIPVKWLSSEYFH